MVVNVVCCVGICIDTYWHFVSTGDCWESQTFWLDPLLCCQSNLIRGWRKQIWRSEKGESNIFIGAGVIIINPFNNTSRLLVCLKVWNFADILFIDVCESVSLKNGGLFKDPNNDSSLSGPKEIFIKLELKLKWSHIIYSQCDCLLYSYLAIDVPRNWALCCNVGRTASIIIDNKPICSNVCRMSVVVCINVTCTDPSVSVGNHVDLSDDDDFWIFAYCLEWCDNPVSCVLDHASYFTIVRLTLSIQDWTLADHASAMGVGFGHARWPYDFNWPACWNSIVSVESNHHLNSSSSSSSFPTVTNGRKAGTVDITLDLKPVAGINLDMIKAHEPAILPDSGDQKGIDLTQCIRNFNIQIGIKVISVCPDNNIVDLRENKTCVEVRTMTVKVRGCCVLVIHWFHAVGKV